MTLENNYFVFHCLLALSLVMQAFIHGRKREPGQNCLRRWLHEWPKNAKFALTLSFKISLGKYQIPVLENI